MFQFPRFPTHDYVFIMGYVGMPPRGFPHSDIPGCSRLHTPRRGFSQCITSFIGTRCQGILRTPLLTFSRCVFTLALLKFAVIQRNCLACSLFPTEYTIVKVLSCSGVVHQWLSTKRLRLPDTHYLHHTVEIRGLEPLTFALQRRRSPS